MVAKDHQSSPCRIAIVNTANHAQRRASTETLSTKLSLPLLDSLTDDSQRYDLLFVVTDHRMEIREVSQRAAGPVYVDFVNGPVAYRRISQGARRQLIARAVGVRSNPLSVIDTTAGLGQDAFMLACLGCSVTAVERSPLLAALIRDGVERAQHTRSIDTQLQDILERMTLVEADARDVLIQQAANHTDEKPADVIYLDPMYPESGKSALSKKEMRICRKLVGDDTDVDSLMTVAMEKAGRRVVVKRHPHAPPLQPNPSICFKGKKVRYDVYLRDNKNL